MADKSCLWLRISPCFDSRGFTLLELVLATFISTLVIGILSVSLSFSLRMWERQQNQKPFSTPSIIELLKWQLTQFNPTPMKAEGQSFTLLAGDKQSITLATGHSVKAISRGIPVIARYVFDPREKKLFYAEVPLDPYHPSVFQELHNLRPGKEKTFPRFYSSDIEDFALAYGGEEKSSFVDSWEGEALPTAVMVRWMQKEDPTAYSYVVYPNFLFSLKQAQEQQKQGGSVLRSPKPSVREQRRTR